MNKLTKYQASVISAYTGVLCGPFDDMHQYCEKILKRPIFSHEFANPLVVAEIKKASFSDFVNICAEK